jgi:hypothetical protein
MSDAKKIDKVEVKMGRLIRVANKNKKQLANEWYWSIAVEDPDGGNERTLLFTAKELERAEERASKNPEDLPKKGLLWDLLD